MPPLKGDQFLRLHASEHWFRQNLCRAQARESYYFQSPACCATATLHQPESWQVLETYPTLEQKKGRCLTPALLMFPQAAPFWRPENGRMFDPLPSDLAFFGWALSPKAVAHLRSFL
jgi:hypothetical protein